MCNSTDHWVKDCPKNRYRTGRFVRQAPRIIKTAMVERADKPDEGSLTSDPGTANDEVVKELSINESNEWSELKTMLEQIDFSTMTLTANSETSRNYIEKPDLENSVKKLRKNGIPAESYSLEQENPTKDPVDLEEYDVHIEVGLGEVTKSDQEQDFQADEAICEELKSQLAKAREAGIINTDQSQQYYELLVSRLSAFGLKQSLCRMSDLEALRVRLKPGTQPFQAEHRRMGPEVLKAMRSKIQDLVTMGMLQRDQDCYFSSPAFMVPKKNGTWRMVVDLRRVNACVEKIAVSLPNLEAQLSWLPSGIQYMAGMDMLSGFDLLRTHPEDTQYFGISTPFGTYRMLGAPMGYTNTPQIYQERMTQDILGAASEGAIFATTPEGVLQWLDDSLIYATSWEGFLETVSTYLDNCIKWKVRLNVMKCQVIARKITWCGRSLTPKGWQYSTEYFEKILKIPEPSPVQELE